VSISELSTRPEPSEDAGAVAAPAGPDAEETALDEGGDPGAVDAPGRPPRRRTRRLAIVPWFALIMTVFCMFAVLLVGYLFVFSHLSAQREQRLLASHFNGRTALTSALGRPVPDGTPVATLTIPAIAVHQIVVSGTSAADLAQGPGLMPRTAPPGVRGNSVIAGRRVTYGRPFARLSQLRRGETITVVNGRGHFTYRIVRTGVARPGQADPVAPSARPELTLVTSPPLSQSGREFVVATLVGRPLAQPPYVITRPDRELALSGDASALPGALVWGVVAFGSVVATVLAYRRWPQTGIIYLLSTPIILATGVLWFEHLAHLLPATF
jgi:sortase A